MEETLEERGKSLAAPLIFMIVVAFQLISRHAEQKKKSGSMTDTEIQLRAEIKQLYKEASSLSQPSTFAQAAKLRRVAAAKEKELTKIQESHSKDTKLSYDSRLKVLMIVKVLTYFGLICWFWRVPVAAISEQLVQPFGMILSWRSGGLLNDNVMVNAIAILYTYLFVFSTRETLHEEWTSSYLRYPIGQGTKVGIIPWLIVSTRVGKIISRKVFK